MGMDMELMVLREIMTVTRRRGNLPKAIDRLLRDSGRWMISVISLDISISSILLPQSFVV